jgi:defect-in-organelle-trafficking protein DotB
MAAGTNGDGAFSRGKPEEMCDIPSRMGAEEFDAVLAWCAERKASDITFQTGEPVWADFGGRWTPITRRALSQPEMEEIAGYAYGPSAAAEIKSGFDLDPAHEVRFSGRRMRYRVNISGGRADGGGDGLQMTVRTLPEMPLDISVLGLEDEIVSNFRPKDGMILVTGTTGSGKSTLLSSVIRHIIEKPEANEKILEYSAPIEYVYDKVRKPSSIVHQTEVGRHLRSRSGEGEESLFAYCVRNALRRKPTIILIGESRDRATCTASMEAALTGHLLYTTMHTIGVAETLRRVMSFYPGGERRGIAIDLMETLRMTVSQTLLPRVGGGKVGCREYLVFDRRTREIFSNEPDLEAWPSMARRILDDPAHTGCSMTRSARKLLDEGLIAEETYGYIAARGKE